MLHDTLAAASSTVGTNLSMWSAVVGFLLPPFVSVVQQAKWPTWARSVVGFVACLAAATGTVYIQGPEVFTWQRWTTAALTVFVAAMTAYKALWQPTGIAASIEQKTTPTKKPARK